jgi:hypothetical protein
LGRSILIYKIFGWKWVPRIGWRRWNLCHQREAWKTLR